MTSPIRVLIVDDDPMARAGIEALLGTAADLIVVGTCADGDEVSAALALMRADVVLSDVRMPRMDGIAVAASLAASGPPVLMMTSFDDDGLVLTAVRAGARGFMLKGDDPKRILAAVRSVAAGDGEFSPRVAGQIASMVRNDPREVNRRDAEARMAQLTERERELAIAVAEGGSDSELAVRFYIGETTVKSTLAAIRAKWGVRTRTDVAVTVVRAGAA